MKFQSKVEDMKLSDAIEQALFENKLVGVRCKLCGELLTYSAMNVADDPYGVKEHYKEVHSEVDLDKLFHDANLTSMIEDFLSHLQRRCKEETGNILFIPASSSFVESSWYRDMLNEHRKYLRKESEAYLCGSSDGKFPPINHWPSEDMAVSEVCFGKSIPKCRIWWKEDEYNVFLELAKSIDNERYRRIYFGGFENSTTNNVKLSTDMDNKEKINDEPYEGDTLYSVLRDRILEKMKLMTNATIHNNDMVRELLHTTMKDVVELLVLHELSKANAKFPPFASSMEGWAVLKEEIEEAKEELDGITCCHDNLWNGIRQGYHPSRPSSVIIAGMKHCSIRLIEEAIQVAAMALKYEAMLERNENKEE